MLNGYRNLLNLHGFRAMMKGATMPNPAMAIGGDDEMSDTGIVIFTHQNLPAPVPTVEAIYNLPYEALAVKGANDTLSMEDFVTDDFTLGAPFDFLV